VPADLHVHTYRDGDENPAPDLDGYINAALAAGLSVLAVTDRVDTARSLGLWQLRGKEAGMSMKVSTLRLPESMAKKLAAIGRADGIPVSEVLREGIENHIAARFSDEEFKERLRKAQQEDRDVLKDLGIED
jgi:predicted DNA-binding protein